MEQNIESRVIVLEKIIAALCEALQAEQSLRVDYQVLITKVRSEAQVD